MDGIVEMDDNIWDLPRRSSTSNSSILFLHHSTLYFPDFSGEDVFKEVMTGGTCGLIPRTASCVHGVHFCAADDAESPWRRGGRRRGKS